MKIDIKDIKIGFSEFTGEVYAGKLSKDGTKWIEKVNITSQYLFVVKNRKPENQQTLAQIINENPYSDKWVTPEAYAAHISELYANQIKLSNSITFSVGPEPSEIIGCSCNTNWWNCRLHHQPTPEGKYKLVDGKIIKKGHTMFLEDVVTDLNRLAFLESERIKAQQTPEEILSSMIDEMPFQMPEKCRPYVLEAITIASKHHQEANAKLVEALRDIATGRIDAIGIAKEALKPYTHE